MLGTDNASKKTKNIVERRIAFAYFLVCIIGCLITYACPLVFAEWWRDASSLAESVLAVVVDRTVIALAYIQINWSKITRTKVNRLADELKYLKEHYLVPNDFH